MTWNVYAAVKKSPVRLLLSFWLAVFTALYLEMMREGISFYFSGVFTGFLCGSFSGIDKLEVLVQGFLAFLLYTVLFYNAEQLLRFLERYRYLIAVILLAVCVLLKISGSSIAYYFINTYGVSSEEELRQLGVLSGISRAIRTDEWAVYTPFALSQEYTGYSAVSEIIRGTGTDVTTVYGAPAWALVTLFRPFLWCYLLLGSEYGLSFFWCARIIFLFLATYECARIYTGNNRWLSASAAVMTTFSPIVLWWFNTNGLVEMLVFGQYAVVLLSYYFRADKRRTRILCAIGLIECAGGFVFTYYPSWEVPFLFVFLALAVWLTVRYYSVICKNFSEHAVILGGAVLILLCLAAGILYFSRDAIRAVMSTVYPGSRVSLGGGGDPLSLFAWLKNLLLPVDPERLTGGNPCEAATFFSFFPCGTVYALTRIRKKNDLLLKLLVILQIFFLVFYLVGMPGWLAKVTLMSYVTTRRIVVVIGYLETVILFRSLSLRDEREPASIYPALLAGAGLAVLFTVLACISLKHVFSDFFIIKEYPRLMLLAGIFGFCFLFVHRGERGLLGTLAVVLGISGFFVNPVQQGIPVDEMPVVAEIQAIAGAEPDALWIVDECHFTVGNLPIMAGARCLNSTSVYPDMEKWSLLDPDHEAEDIYNRYAHIVVRLDQNTDDGTGPEFELLYKDSFQLTLDLESLQALEVQYILSTVDYSGVPVWGGNLELISQTDPFYIYRVK